MAHPHKVVRACANDRYSDSVAYQQDGVSLRIFRLSRRFRERLYADMTFHELVKRTNLDWAASATSCPCYDRE